MTSDAAVATSINQIADLPLKARNEYWRIVETTLTEVFHLSPEEAGTRAKELRRRVEELPSDAQLFNYHMEPLQIAADLAGAFDRSLTPTERRAYVKIRIGSDLDAPGPESTDPLFPDDIPAAAAE